MVVARNEGQIKRKTKWRNRNGEDRKQLGKDLRKAKIRAMYIKVKNNQENCAEMFNGVQDVLGWRTGGELTMLTINGGTTQNTRRWLKTK